MANATRQPGKVLDRIAKVVGLVSGIGFAVTSKQRASNVATLTAAGHDIQIGDKFLVQGVDSTFNGYATCTARTSTTFSYANTGSNTGPASCSGMVSKRLAQGKRRFQDTEECLEDVISSLTDQTQGYFAFYLISRAVGNQTEVSSMTVSGLLFAKLDKDTDSDVNGLMDFAENIAIALGVESNFSPIGARPSSIEYTESPDNFEDGISVWEFTMIYKLGAVSGA